MSFSQEVKLEIKKKYYKHQSEELKIIMEAFLKSGSINSPRKEYNLQILSKNSTELSDRLKELGITAKVTSDRIYIKDGEQISSILALMGASNAVIKFEEARVVKEIANNVNRIVNCETANLNKTIDASVSQVEDIKYLKKKNKFKDLPTNLKEIADLRVENPDATLQELGEMLKAPISKSGVNHRLRKISKIVNVLKEEGK